MITIKKTNHNHNKDNKVVTKKCFDAKDNKTNWLKTNKNIKRLFTNAGHKTENIHAIALKKEFDRKKPGE